jgi:hypothetical protein
MGQFLGHSLVQLHPLDNTETPIQDLQFYEDDQKKHGVYQKLKAQVIKNSIQFPICLDISDIALIESKGFNGLHQVQGFLIKKT